MTIEELIRSEQRLVKICGIRSEEAAKAATEAGADLIGFVFAPVRRQVSADRAAEIGGSLSSQPRSQRPNRVGLFVDPQPDLVNRVAEDGQLDVLQLHGVVDPASLEQFERPVIRAVRTKPGESVSSIRQSIDVLMSTSRPPVAIQVDGFHPAQHGGMGARADWSVAAELSREYPVLLAGGLDSHNVGEAIETVRPRGVDVSSGVEIDGEKDAGKIAEFIAAARFAFDRTC